MMTQALARQSTQRDSDMPVGWAMVRLGDLYSLSYGKGLPKRARNTHGPHPVYGSNGVVGYHDSYLVDGPVIIVGRKGTAGAVWFSENPCWPIDTTYYVRGNEHIDIRFSFHLFTSLRLSRFDRSTAIPGLNRNDVYELTIHLPPLPEQRRIAAKIDEMFSTLGNGLESLKRANALLADYRQTLLSYAFEGKLTEQWRKENKDRVETPEQLITRIKQERKVHYEQQLEDWFHFVNDDADRKPGTSLSKPIRPADIVPISDDRRGSLTIIPPSWEWIYLKHVGQLVTGTTPSTKDRANYGGTLPFFKPSDLDQGMRVQEAQAYLSQRGQQSARILPSSSTLVTCIGATIGKTGFAMTRCATNQQINAIVPEIGIDPKFVYFQAIAPLFREQLTSSASATTLPILNKSKFGELSFALCSLEEQREIVRLLDESITKIELIERIISTTSLQVLALRQSILNMAFSGQLVAQDCGEEPVSVLMERIRAERQRIVKRGQRQAARSRDGR